MSLTKFKMVFEKENSEWCLRQKITLGYQLNKNLVLVEAV